MLHIKKLIPIVTFLFTQQISATFPGYAFDAARFGNYEKMKKYLTKFSYTEKDLSQCLGLSASTGRTQVFNLILDTLKKNNMLKGSALNHALYSVSRYSGNIEIIATLIKEHADIKFQDHLPIKMAIKYNHINAAKVLLLAGADQKICHEEISYYTFSEYQIEEKEYTNEIKQFLKKLNTKLPCTSLQNICTNYVIEHKALFVQHKLLPLYYTLNTAL